MPLGSTNKVLLNICSDWNWNWTKWKWKLKAKQERAAQISFGNQLNYCSNIVKCICLNSTNSTRAQELHKLLLANRSKIVIAFLLQIRDRQTNMSNHCSTYEKIPRRDPETQLCAFSLSPTPQSHKWSSMSVTISGSNEISGHWLKHELCGASLRLKVFQYKNCWRYTVQLYSSTMFNNIVVAAGMWK